MFLAIITRKAAIRGRGQHFSQSTCPLYSLVSFGRGRQQCTLFTVRRLQTAPASSVPVVFISDLVAYFDL